MALTAALKSNDIKIGRAALDAAQHQVLDGIVADCAEPQGVLHRAVKRFEIEGLQKPQDLDVFPLAGLAHARLQQTAQGRERAGQFPAGQRRGLIQGGDLLFQQRQIVDRIEDHIIPLVRTGVPGDDPVPLCQPH